MNKLTYSEIFILIVPLINSVVLILDYFTGNEIVHFGIIRAIYMFSVVGYFFFFFRITKSDLFIFLFLGYLAFLIPFSSSMQTSLDLYAKVFLSFMMFPIAYWFVNSEMRFKKVNKIYVSCGLLLIITFILSQILGIGANPYSEDSVLLLGGVYIANILAYFSIILMYLIASKLLDEGTVFKVVILVLSIIIVLLVFRRSAILALFSGLLAYYFLTNHKYKNIKYLIAASTILLITSPFYIDQLDMISQVRSFDGVADSNAGRWQDLIRAYNQITDHGTFHTLFGIELFNYRDFHKVRRNIHNDFGQILHGAGFIGLILFISVFLNILKSAIKKKNEFFRSGEKQNLFALTAGLITASLIISFANQLWVVSSFSFVMFYLGAIVGYMNVLNEKR